MFNPERYIRKNVLIIGGGKSGLSCAKLLSKKLKNRIIISDKKEIKTKYDLIYENEIKKIIKKIDFAIKSPGITNENIVVKSLTEKNIPIYSEVEVALSFSKTDNIIMITGTNGKSTTTYLTYKIFDDYLKKQNKKAVLCGNIGIPVSDNILKAKEDDWLVIEISSYQLEYSTYLKPKIASILNITPDHIEHHKTMENYIKAKAKIFEYMDENGILILNYDDKILRKFNKTRPKRLYFSLKSKNADIYFDGKKIITDNFSFTPSNIPGKHNIANEMVAILCALSQKIDPKSIQETLKKFKGLEHRIEFVKEIKGVKYINDSKGTNVDSTIIALKAVGKKKNIFLILGGKHKNSPYTPLIPYIKKYVKKIVTIGEAKSIIKEDLKQFDIIDAGDLKNAMNIIYKTAKKGDIVLLSPACASFDQFKNFEDRGKKFKALVEKLYEK